MQKLKPLSKPAVSNKASIINLPQNKNEAQEQVLSFEERKESILIPDKNGSFSIHSLATIAEKIQSKCYDYVVKNSAENFKAVNNFGLLKATTNPNPQNQTGKLDFTEHSLNQLCNRLEVPFSYIKKCHTSGKTDLAIDNLNSWIQITNKNYFVRVYDNQIRGLLSTKYTTFDVPDILDVIDDVANFDEYRIKGYTINQERFHLRLVGDKLDIPNEDIFAGIQIDSSDVGRSRLFVTFFIYKHVCTNGLVRAIESDNLYVQRHMGISKDVFAQEFSDSIKRLPEIAAEAVENILFASKTKVKSIYSADENIVEQIKHVTGLAENIVNKGWELMQQNYTPTVWGLINGLTEASKEYTLEKRIDIERRAGLLLTA